MWEVLSSYIFIVAALGAVILSVAAGAIGSISVIKGQSLIGDAIGHSAFPGIVVIFMVFQTREPVLLLLGAFVAGAIAYFLIDITNANSKLKLDTSLAIILSTMFGLGMVLKSYISGNVKYAKSTQAGLDNYIYGQAALVLEKDVIIIAIVSAVSLLILLLFYKEIKLFIFDPQFARISNFRPRAVSVVVLVMTMLIIAVGLKTVGAVLISSLLITPGVVGLLWSDKFSTVLFIAIGVGAVSGFIGTYLSSSTLAYPNGPSIIIVMSLIAIFSLLFGKRGIIKIYLERKKHE